MKINNYKISNKNLPYIIAEFSGNHNGEINNFYKLIKIAKKAGANAIKLQTFKPDELTINSQKKQFIVKHKFKKWNNKSLFQLYEKAYTPWEWHIKIKRKAKEYDLDFICTAFHQTSVDFLKEINVDCIKISSFEFNDTSLIQYAAKTKIPMILSCGMASLNEIKTNYQFLKKKLNNSFAFLKCTSSYPASINSLNLQTINFLKKKFNCQIGYSDHSIGNVAAITAIANGATIIEKHLSLGKKVGIDSNFSCTPSEFIKFVKECKDASLSLGKVGFGPTNEELNSFKNRKSIFAISDIKIGEKFSHSNVASIRPGAGLDPKKMKSLIGKKSKKKFNKGEPINKEQIN